jgi:hypothetical protein
MGVMVADGKLPYHHGNLRPDIHDPILDLFLGESPPGLVHMYIENDVAKLLHQLGALVDHHLMALSHVRALAYHDVVGTLVADNLGKRPMILKPLVFGVAVGAVPPVGLVPHAEPHVLPVLEQPGDLRPSRRYNAVTAVFGGGGGQQLGWPPVGAAAQIRVVVPKCRQDDDGIVLPRFVHRGLEIGVAVDRFLHVDAEADDVESPLVEHAVRKPPDLVGSPPFPHAVVLDDRATIGMVVDLGESHAAQCRCQ